MAYQTAEISTLAISGPQEALHETALLLFATLVQFWLAKIILVILMTRSSVYAYIFFTVNKKRESEISYRDSHYSGYNPQEATSVIASTEVAIIIRVKSGRL